jgi:hypothetical protein
MIKKLSELNLTEEQKKVFTEASDWVFINEMGSGCDWETKERIINFINENANLPFEIDWYYPDFYNSDDKIRIKGEQ